MLHATPSTRLAWRAETAWSPHSRFLGTDLTLWASRLARRIGYRPYFSGIGINADAELLIQRR